MGLGLVHQTFDVKMQAQMADLADAFIAIPGGFGTLEELLEVVTWNQIGLIVKPVGVLNVCGYFDHLLKFFDHAVQEVGCAVSCLPNNSNHTSDNIDSIQIINHHHHCHRHHHHFCLHTLLGLCGTSLVLPARLVLCVTIITFDVELLQVS